MAKVQKPMKKAQTGIKLKPGQVTAKRAYAIADSLKNEASKPVDMTSKKTLETSLKSKQANRQKAGRLYQRADDAVEKAGGERRYAKNPAMAAMKKGGKIKKK